MNAARPSVLDLLRLTANNPRAAMAAVQRMQLSSPVAWQAFALVLVLYLIFARLLSLLIGSPEPVEGALSPELVRNPLLLGAVQSCLFTIGAFVIHWVGRAFGGHGRLEDAVALVALFLLAFLAINIFELLLVALIPMAAAGVMPFHLILFFYLLTLFVTELHGFSSPGLVFLGILGTLLGLVVSLSILLTILVVAITGGLPAHV